MQDLKHNTFLYIRLFWIALMEGIEELVVGALSLVVGALSLGR